MTSKRIIFLLGLPGSGKGTQGGLLSKKLGLPHISTGDIFRNMINSGADEASMLAECIKEGKLIPGDLVNQLVKKFVLSDDCVDGCILDGYPRTIEQAEYFDKNVCSDVNIIFFDIDSDTVIKRILGRISCVSCGKIYNKYFDKPLKDGVCDECGATEFVTRSDDDENTIMLRIKEYEKETMPLIEHYKKKSNFFTIKAGESKEKVITALADIVKRV